MRATIGVALALAGLCAAVGGAYAASGTSTKVALGNVNPAQGDCATNTKERGAAVGYVVVKLTASSFEAKIVLNKGTPGAYGVFMQQVPGSCPQGGANGSPGPGREELFRPTRAGRLRSGPVHE
jgi:hypothetical protein